MLSVPLRDWLGNSALASSNQGILESVYAVSVAVLMFWSFGIVARWLEVAKSIFGSSQIPMVRHGQMLLVWFWCAIQPVFIIASGWLGVIETFSGASTWRCLQLIFLLLPSWLVLLSIGLGCFIGRSCQPQAKLDGRPAIQFWRWYWVHSAHTWLLPFATAVMVACITDFTGVLAYSLPGIGLQGSIAATLLLSIGVTVLSPHLFAILIRASAMDAGIEQRVKCVWEFENHRAPRILFWPTGCRVANAAVVGMVGFGRKLLLTDALLQRLSERELDMVVLHELAHCIRYHAWIRLLPTLGTIGLLFLAMQQFSGILLGLICGVLFGSFLLSLIFVCWWTEFDADRVAIRIGAKRDHLFAGTSAGHSSQDDLMNALRKIYGAGNWNRSSWMHPSCERRIASILREADQSLGYPVEIASGDA